ncbi:hypothetical protein [Pararhodobacter sp. SW119]|uniref:hypothetical protein n=1 Tax=Pararhodobacter sp. SW119 TaxID=2780075 RepID=UPI001AE0B80A|nr:hypothetical protein [Pararhodobacter sp. SW119]
MTETRTLRRTPSVGSPWKALGDLKRDFQSIDLGKVFLRREEKAIKGGEAS